jgi:ElaB/YqjD/DUF883 family membrane-anchored ribosome-binding protein
MLAMDDLRSMSPIANRSTQTEQAVSVSHDVDLAELRQEFEDVMAQWTAAVAARAAQTADAVGSAVSRRPWTSIALAAAAGAAVALLVVPRRQPSTIDSTTAHLEQLARRTRGTISSYVETEPLVSRFSKALESISNLDASSLPAFPTSVATWLKSFLPGINKS